MTDKSYFLSVQRNVLDIVGRNVLFVDGQCLLCNWILIWILKNNKNQTIIVTTFQGKFAKSLLSENIFKEVVSTVDSVAMLTVDGRLLIKSEAILEILFLIGGVWGKIAYFLNFIPVGVRNVFYMVIAKNRYKWFSRSKECQIQVIRKNKLFLN